MSRPAHAHIVTRQQSKHPTQELPYRGLDLSQFTPLRDGAYVLSRDWDELFSEGRLRTRAIAVGRRQTTPLGAVSHQTAAAMHGLPVFRSRSDMIDVIVASPTTRHDSLDVRRRQGSLLPGDVDLIDGIRVTSLERTVYDVIRTASLEAAVVCFDAALRAVAWFENSYDQIAAAEFWARVNERIKRNGGARGIRQARFVAEFADGRAQLPGESVARLWMWQLGLPTPILQYRVDFPDGSYALLDFAWPKLRRWGEFDGLVKYVDAEILAGRTPDEVLALQNSREHQVRDATGWRCDRWGFAQMDTIDTFAVYLRSVGLYA